MKTRAPYWNDPAAFIAAHPHAFSRWPTYWHSGYLSTVSDAAEYGLKKLIDIPIQLEDFDCE